MSHTFSVKFRVLRREFLRNHSVYWAQISAITETIMLFNIQSYYIISVLR